MLKAAQRE